MNTASRTGITASDGATLAVYHYTPLDPQRPTILAIHGWPDNHHLWDPVAELLGDRYNVVAYDVSGSGESSCPASRSGYRLEQLVSDTGAVIDSLGVDRVHLLAHDWGSIQGWAAVTADSVMEKVASFTSISGPHLQYAGAFLRSGAPPLGGPGCQAACQFGIHRVLLVPGRAGTLLPFRHRGETRWGV
ncbi:alpha/beta hydrolase fold family protein [Mycobacterium ulcerans str. Harvey]|uniref:Alpha/beta hydrolase fold family protein n=1 Tax=Mycobacterium ulcerans str. Harvey TaxID=1299332 RepID=A0ABN0QZR6_MYCUL|nr:alpha/beta hydrolase fold family protein [Mycobacterium ulcerans str. Harvey]